MEEFRLKKLSYLIIPACLLSFLIVFWQAYRLYYVPIIPLTKPAVIISLEPATSAYEFSQNLKKITILILLQCFF